MFFDFRSATRSQWLNDTYALGSSLPCVTAQASPPRMNETLALLCLGTE